MVLGIGELITITAGTGSGKTSFVRDLASSLCQKGETVGILELESNTKRTALGLMSSAVGKALHIWRTRRIRFKGGI